MSLSFVFNFLPKLGPWSSIKLIGLIIAVTFNVVIFLDVGADLEPEIETCAAKRFDDFYETDPRPVCYLNKSACLTMGKFINWIGLMSFQFGVLLFWLPVMPFYSCVKRKLFQANGWVGRVFWGTLLLLLIVFPIYYWVQLEEFRVTYYDNLVNTSEIKLCCGFFREMAASRMKIVQKLWQVYPLNSMSKVCNL